jgi:hypothetical protein
MGHELLVDLVGFTAGLQCVRRGVHARGHPAHNEVAVALDERLERHAAVGPLSSVYIIASGILCL